MGGPNTHQVTVDKTDLEKHQQSKEFIARPRCFQDKAMDTIFSWEPTPSTRALTGRWWCWLEHWGQVGGPSFRIDTSRQQVQ